MIDYASVKEYMKKTQSRSDALLMIINVSRDFEPGAESIGDFLIKVSEQLRLVGETCNSLEDKGEDVSSFDKIDKAVTPLISTVGNY